MNYRSTQADGRYVHFGGSLVAGSELGSGIELNAASSASAPTILPVGDETDKNILIGGKGTGGVQIGAASTTPMALIQRYFIQFTVPALSSAASAESSVTVTGATTNAVYIFQNRVKLNSTVTGVFITPRCSTANEVVLEFHNCSQSSLSGSTQSGTLVQIGF